MMCCCKANEALVASDLKCPATAGDHKETQRSLGIVWNYILKSFLKKPQSQ